MMTATYKQKREINWCGDNLNLSPQGFFARNTPPPSPSRLSANHMSRYAFTQLELHTFCETIIKRADKVCVFTITQYIQSHVVEATSKSVPCLVQVVEMTNDTPHKSKYISAGTPTNLRF